MRIQYIQYSGGKFNNMYNSNNFNKKPSKFKKILLILCILAVIGGTGFGLISYKYGAKRVIDKGLTILSNTFSPIAHSIDMKIANIKGITDIYYNIDEDSAKTINYVNSELKDKVSLNALSKTSDVHTIIQTDSFDRFVNHPIGYYINLPKDLEYDVTHSPNYIKAYSKDMDITISLEESPYFDVFDYIKHYENRFFLDENYQKENNIEIKENIEKELNNKDCYIVSLTRNTDSTEYPFNTYTYAYMKLYGTKYLRIMIKSNEYNNATITELYTSLLKSFTLINPEFVANYQLALYPIPNEKWNTNTKQIYSELQSSTNIKWGIFTTDVANKGINEEIPDIEKKIEKDFDIILMYNHLGKQLPLEAMKAISSQGKMIELTVQTCANNNTKLFDYTPMFDIIDGKLDKEIIQLAKEIKSLDTTILFRLNNEMNSDWTSYSGVVNLCDPDIYIAVWQRIYNIFVQEKVENCIWIFNPNDNNYPPCNWNNFLAYYPGNEYVQMIGITGYNTGTYYFAQNGEVWREFDTIYNEINQKYKPLFNGFPWIITEFASSSVGGNKAQWISNMFDNINKYTNIKAAVWFSSADYDEDGNVTRPYWINESEETLDAFKNGINR